MLLSEERNLMNGGEKVLLKYADFMFNTKHSKCLCNYIFSSSRHVKLSLVQTISFNSKENQFFHGLFTNTW